MPSSGGRLALRPMHGVRRVLGVVLCAAIVASGGAASSGEKRPTTPNPNIHKIKHVVVIMQENRSFDSYFGTYPGAEGIPRGVCVSDPRGGCVKPFHNPRDRNTGGPHALDNAKDDIDGGLMDGFVRESVGATAGCTDPNDPVCVAGGGGREVMGYHDAREIPNYWAYARTFVLQDHMFEPNTSWSLPAHLFTVSMWSAQCDDDDPDSCTNNVGHPGDPPDFNTARHPEAHPPTYAWTDLTYLLHRAHVSWRYYVAKGNEPDCADDALITCPRVAQS